MQLLLLLFCASVAFILWKRFVNKIGRLEFVCFVVARCRVGIQENKSHLETTDLRSEYCRTIFLDFQSRNFLVFPILSFPDPIYVLEKIHSFIAWYNAIIVCDDRWLMINTEFNCPFFNGNYIIHNNKRWYLTWISANVARLWWLRRHTISPVSP